MLVLDRKVEEEIVIGGDIIIKVIAIGQNRIKLGIVAPGERILRGELVGKERTGKQHGQRQRHRGEQD